MRKSQLYSQMFIYVLTIILISFILAYGYNSIQNFKKRAEQVSCLQFKNDLSSAVKSMSGDFGSVKKKDLEMCNDYKKVCFVETFAAIDKNKLPSNLDPIIRDSILSDIGKNAFLVDDVAKESFYIGRISVKPAGIVACMPARNSRVSLKLEGKGNYVLISEWPNP